MTQEPTKTQSSAPTQQTQINNDYIGTLIQSPWKLAIIGIITILALIFIPKWQANDITECTNLQQDPSPQNTQSETPKPKNVQQQDICKNGVDSVTIKKERITVENAARGTLVQVFTGLFFFVTAYFTWQNLKVSEANLQATQKKLEQDQTNAQENLQATQKKLEQDQTNAKENLQAIRDKLTEDIKNAKANLEVAEDKQVTERFSKAIELLGNEKIDVRIGAIYALERIAKDSDKDYWTIMEILTAYVRERSPYPSKEQSNKKYTPFWAENNNTSETDNQKDILPITTDIQAVLTVLSRRTKSYKQGEDNRLDLSKSNLKEANLEAANLKEAFLKGAFLKGANLRRANLRRANLPYAELEQANLSYANLYKANLYKANLKKAILENASLYDHNEWLIDESRGDFNPWSTNLKGANLEEVNLESARLNRVSLEEANLEGANLEGAFLEDANLEEANLERARLGINFKEMVIIGGLEIKKGVLILQARLERSNLKKANLKKANLKKALLEEAHLEGAFLDGANLDGANLYKANLEGANLDGANLDGANLEQAKLVKVENLTIEQLENSKNWQQAEYEPEVRACLVPPEEPEKQI